jgi:hypothetical protein
MSEVSREHNTREPILVRLAAQNGGRPVRAAIINHDDLVRAS